MNYFQYDFERKVLKVGMVSFYEHLIKLRLCNKEFSDQFHKNLYSYAKHYENDWKKQSIHLCVMIFKKMHEKTISKPGTMQKAFLSTLDNMDIEMVQRDNGIYNAIKRATSDFKYQKDVLYIVEDWVKFIDLNSISWFNAAFDFLKSLTPKNNQVLDLKIVEKKATEFVNKFNSI